MNTLHRLLTSSKYVCLLIKWLYTSDFKLFVPFVNNSFLNSLPTDYTVDTVFLIDFVYSIANNIYNI